jgi:hypothetical protein
LPSATNSNGGYSALLPATSALLLDRVQSRLGLGHGRAGGGSGGYGGHRQHPAQMAHSHFSSVGSASRSMTRRKKVRLRSCFGRSNNVAGVPSSMIRPSSMTAMRSETFAGKSHLVGDDDHRHPAFGERAHHREDFAHQLGIERRRHLVEQHHLWIHGERTGNRDPLLLAARELARIGVLLGAQPDAGNLLAADGDRSLPLHSFHVDRRLDHVLQHGQMWEQVELLEDDADPLAQAVELRFRHADAGSAAGQPSDRLAVDGDLALLERFQEIDAGKERALAGAAGADHGHDLAARHIEVDALEHLGVAEALVQVPDPHHRRRRLGLRTIARFQRLLSKLVRSGRHAAVPLRHDLSRCRSSASSMVVRT